VGGFGVLIALIALLGWVTLSQFSSLRSIQRRVFNEAIPGLVAVNEIVRSFTAQSAAVRGFLIGNQQSLLAQYHSEVSSAQFWEERAERLFTAGEERRLLDQLIAAGREFQELVDSQVIPLAEQGNRSQAFRVLSQDGALLINEVELSGQLLLAAQDRVVAEAEAELRGGSNQTIVILAVVLLGTLIVGVVLAITLPRRLVEDLNRLVEAARAIGRGDLDQELQIRSGDEVEELAERFGEMQAGLKRLQQLAMQELELGIAAEIQRNLVQRSLPEVPGVRIASLQRQANRVGGDWYDVDVDSGVVTVAVGDASGKGIGAALMATVALSVLRAERGLGSDLARVVERTNEALREASDLDSFTTLVYLRLDPRSGEVTWLNMGHPAPFLLARPGRGERRGGFLDGPRNRALGWFDDPGFAEGRARLEPGDRLLVYTDGFLEARAPDGDVFGEHRFAEAVARLAPLDTPLLVEELIGHAERFAAGKLDDDLTMLVIEFEGIPVRAQGSGTEQELGREQTWHSRRSI
jgi:serine phosphatase RsbU (regulator of sigma subunit)